MFRKLIAAFSFSLMLASPAWCQADSRSSGAEGAQKHSNFGGKFGAPVFFDQGSPMYTSPQVHMDTTPGAGNVTADRDDGRIYQQGGQYHEHNQLTPEGWSDVTTNNGIGSPNGPDLPGTSAYAAGGGPGDSGAATSAPFPGSFIAPSNFALKQIRRNTLPPTRLDSFVYQSGYNDHIYGDEGTNGPPPYDDFEYIENRNWHPHMTTGHPSDAPSAWGTPQ